MEQLQQEPGELVEQRVRDELRDTLALALRAGQIMLESGANTSRVEETVHHIGAALGAEAMHVYATPSGIIGSIHVGAEHRTRVLRVVASTVSLSRIADVVAVSRRAVARSMTRSEVALALERIAVQPRSQGHWTTTIAVAAACACFAVLFGAGPREAAASALAAAIAQQMRVWLMATKLNRLIMTTLVSALAAGTALGLSILIGGALPAVAMLASVLLLVPGVVMVSAVVDLFRGDTLAGISRAVAATLSLIAIAVGLWLVLTLSSVQLPTNALQAPMLALGAALAFGATVGFAVVFDAPRRALLGCGLVGALAYVVRQTTFTAGMPIELAMFLGGLVVGLLGEVLARVVRLPASIFTIPGFIPLVPGTLGFRTVLSFVERDYTAGVANLVEVLLLTGALATGLATVQVLARLRR